MEGIHLLRLLIIFLVIIVLLAYKRALYQAISAGLLAAALLYRISPVQCIELASKVLINWSSLSLLLILYLITFLQRMLEKRGQIKLAQEDLNGLFHNRRVNASAAPVFIGLLPSAAAMILCGDIIKDSCNGYLDKKEQAVVASWFRHIPETTLPTYSGVLLMSRLAGVPIPQFILGMAVPLLCLVALGYFPYLRKIPKDPGTPRSSNKRQDAQNLMKHLWTLPLVIFFIIAVGLSVELSVGIVILLAVLVYRFQWTELRPMFAGAFETKLLVSTFLVLVLKEFIAYTGMLEALPALFSELPVPLYVVFSLLFFVGSLVSGTTGIIALGTPMAFAAIPGAGMPLMVLLMCMCHAASQISPTHVCLVVATEYFGISLGDMVKKTLPLSLAFCALMLVYYQFLLLLF